MLDVRVLTLGALVGIAAGYGIWGSGVHAQSALQVSTYAVTTAEREAVWVINTTTGQVRDCFRSREAGKPVICGDWTP